MPDLHNLAKESLGRIPKFFRRFVRKDDEKRRKLMENAENFSSPHNVLSGPDQRYRASLRDRIVGGIRPLLSPARQSDNVQLDGGSN